jgi:hypothetical protein
MVDASGDEIMSLVMRQQASKAMQVTNLIYIYPLYTYIAYVSIIYLYLYLYV